MKNSITPSENFPQFAETWIENWTTELYALSFPQIGICLERHEVNYLGKLNGIQAHCFNSLTEEDPHTLENKLDNALCHFSEGAFIRLGSRSPKDTILGIVGGCRVFNGKQAIRLLSSGSYRIAYDLRVALQFGYKPWIFVRQWIDIPTEMEFRCFMKNRQLIGVSQYFCETSFPTLDLSIVMNTIKPLIDDFFLQFSKHSPLNDVVFDIALFLKDIPHVKLIEINPFHPLTQACLFSWDSFDFDGSFRVIITGKPRTIAM